MATKDFRFIVKQYEARRREAEEKRDLVLLKNLDNDLYDVIRNTKDKRNEDFFLEQIISRHIFIMTTYIGLAFFDYAARILSWSEVISERFYEYLRSNGWLDECEIVEAYIEKNDHQAVALYCRTHLFADKNQEYFPAVLRSSVESE